MKFAGNCEEFLVWITGKTASERMKCMGDYEQFVLQMKRNPEAARKMAQLYELELLPTHPTLGSLGAQVAKEASETLSLNTQYNLYCRQEMRRSPDYASRTTFGEFLAILYACKCLKILKLSHQNLGELTPREFIAIKDTIFGFHLYGGVDSLDLSYNSLYKLGRDVHMNFNVKKLYMAYNNLHSIMAHICTGAPYCNLADVSELTEIDLSYNGLDTMDPVAWQTFTQAFAKRTAKPRLICFNGDSFENGYTRNPDRIKDLSSGFTFSEIASNRYHLFQPASSAPIPSSISSPPSQRTYSAVNFSEDRVREAVESIERERKERYQKQQETDRVRDRYYQAKKDLTTTKNSYFEHDRDLQLCKQERDVADARSDFNEERKVCSIS